MNEERRSQREINERGEAGSGRAWSKIREGVLERGTEEAGR